MATICQRWIFANMQRKQTFGLGLGAAFCLGWHGSGWTSWRVGFGDGLMVGLAHAQAIFFGLEMDKAQDVCYPAKR